MGQTLLNFRYRILCIMILVSFALLLPVTATAEQGTGAIPVMPGAEIIKQSSYKGSVRLEILTTETPEKVANFYKQTMEKTGWPSGNIMSIGNQSALMLYDEDRQFALKATLKDGITKVLMSLIQQE